MIKWWRNWRSRVRAEDEARKAYWAHVVEGTILDHLAELERRRELKKRYFGKDFDVLELSATETWPSEVDGG